MSAHSASSASLARQPPHGRVDPAKRVALAQDAQCTMKSMVCIQTEIGGRRPLIMKCFLRSCIMVPKMEEERGLETFHVLSLRTFAESIPSIGHALAIGPS
jgi:hypothetical protein